MKRFIAMLVCSALFLTLSLTGAEKKEREKKRGDFVGTISVSRDDKEKIEAITFSCDSGKTYVLGTKNLPKGVEEGTVEITGTVQVKKDKDDAETLILTPTKIVPVFKGKVNATFDEKDKKKVESVYVGSELLELSAKAKELAIKGHGKEVVVYGKKKTKKTKDGEEETILVISDYKLPEEKKK